MELSKTDHVQRIYRVRVRVELIEGVDVVTEAHEVSCPVGSDEGSTALARCLGIIVESCRWGVSSGSLLLETACHVALTDEHPQLEALAALYDSWGGERDFRDLSSLCIDATSIDDPRARLLHFPVSSDCVTISGLKGRRGT